MADKLLNACRLGNVDQIRDLIDNKREVLSTSESPLNWSPLFLTIIHGHEEATKCLLEAGADVNARTLTGDTPLHQSSDNSSSRIAELLLDFKAEVNAVQNDGDTPLHHAAFKNNPEVAKLLLSNKADIDVANIVFERTPLHYAIAFDNIEVAKILLHFGASQSVKDKAGHSPVDLCVSAEMKELLADPSLWTIETPQSPTQSPLSLPEAVDTIPPISDSLFSFPSVSDVTSAGLGKDNRNLLHNWLISYRLEELFEPLQNSGYDDLEQMTSQMNSSMPLDENILKEIGIKKPGHRRRFLAALCEEDKPAIRGNRNPPKKERQNLLKCCVAPIPANYDFTHLPSLQIWLDNMSLGELHRLFVENGYDDLDSMLPLMHTPWEINEEALNEIGITKIGYVDRILGKLKEDCVHIEGLRRNPAVTSRKRKEQEPEERNDGSCIIM